MCARKWLFIIGITLILVSLSTAAIIAYRTWKTINVIPRSSPPTATATATPTPDPDRAFSILLLGYGGNGHEGGKNTDTMMLAKVEPKKSAITLLSIPRDLWVPLPINGDELSWYKINAAYPIGSNDKMYPHKKIEYTGDAGGGQLAKYVVSQIIGTNVDYFVAVDFAGFEKIINAMGGIDVVVDKTFEDPYYPTNIGTTDPCGKSVDDIKALSATLSGDKLEHEFMCRYEDLHFVAGLQHMDGATALKYARSRHSLTDGGDFNRARRQRIVLESVKAKVVNIGFIPKIIPTLNTLSQHLQTDLDLSTIEKLLSRFSEFSSYKITQVALTDQNVLIDAISADGQFILNPKVGPGNWTEIQNFINHPEQFSPTPTASSSARMRVK